MSQSPFQDQADYIDLQTGEPGSASSSGPAVPGATAPEDAETEHLIQTFPSATSPSNSSVPNEPAPSITGNGNAGQAEVPGELGQRGVSATNEVFIGQSYRRGASENSFRAHNFRYRGHRESSRFNLLTQWAMATFARMLLSLDTKGNQLSLREQEVVPSDDQAALVYHVREQARFQEWNRLRDVNVEWFE